MTAGDSDGVVDLLRAADVDPAAGVQLASGARLPSIAFDPSLPLVLIESSGEAVDAMLPGRHARTGPHALLMALYPRDHELLHLPDRAPHRLEDLDDGGLVGGAWLVPPLDAFDNLASPHGMAAISARLRAPD